MPLSSSLDIIDLARDVVLHTTQVPQPALVQPLAWSSSSRLRPADSLSGHLDPLALVMAGNASGFGGTGGSPRMSPLSPAGGGSGWRSPARASLDMSRGDIAIAAARGSNEGGAQVKHIRLGPTSPFSVASAEAGRISGGGGPTRASTRGSRSAEIVVAASNGMGSGSVAAWGSEGGEGGEGRGGRAGGMDGTGPSTSPAKVGNRRGEGGRSSSKPEMLAKMLSQPSDAVSVGV